MEESDKYDVCENVGLQIYGDASCGDWYCTKTLNRKTINSKSFIEANKRKHTIGLSFNRNKLGNFPLCVIGILLCFATVAMATPQTQSDSTNAIISSKNNETTEKTSIVALMQIRHRGPVIAMVKNNKKCPKHLRKNFCMNRGKCEFIEDLNIPRCKCRDKWEGPRCRVPVFDFDKKGLENSELIIALVVTAFGIVGALLVGCICWRRLKYLKAKKRQQEICEKADDEKKTMLTVKNDQVETIIAPV